MKIASKNKFYPAREAHHLIIDFGNTLTKTAVFFNDQCLEIKTTPHLKPDDLAYFIKKYNPLHAIISSVVKVPDEIRQYLNARSNCIELSHTTPVPISNLYKTPETLGLDRLALAVAATGIFPGHNVLAIDAGTCVTFDFVDDRKNYHGGGISPGIQMRFKALHTFTERLPLINHQNFDGLSGTTTTESILSGVLNGIIAEFDGIIRMYKAGHKDLKVIVTGGDVNFFAMKLKSNIFAAPNLVLNGLNVILNFNVEKEQTDN
jgi:type III pantothenate kinase